ncbi:MAG: RraA family protein [Synergistaceae bacterium]|jgi:regulator of RNase E activity RraA|nr:RraA family protein [Synergistaceae bacterium]
MTSFKNDAELFALMKKELFTAVVGDIMDTMGLIHQFLPAQIRPVKDDIVLTGRAMTVLEADCASVTVSRGGKKEPFGLMFEALDDLKEGEIYICTGGSPTYAHWGELMSTRAIHLKAAGAVVDGYLRDTKGILKLGFPAFSWGPYAQDQGARGRVIDYRCPLEFPNHVRVEPGDLIFGDIDGVVAVPAKHEKEIIEKALEKVRGENEVARAIRAGMSTVDAFAKFGIM